MLKRRVVQMGQVDWRCHDGFAGIRDQSWDAGWPDWSLPVAEA